MQLVTRPAAAAAADSDVAQTAVERLDISASNTCNIFTLK